MSSSAKPAKRLVNISVLSLELGVPKATIYVWTSRNEIPHMKMGRHLRFNLEKVLEFFEKQTAEKKRVFTPLDLGLNRPNFRSLKTRSKLVGSRKRELT